MEPHPLSNTAKGGQKIESKTLQILIGLIFLIDDYLFDVNILNLLQSHKYLESNFTYKAL
jgi:hypothetical protein